MDISLLPLEICQKILGLLSASDLKSCLGVNRRWREICNSEYLWKHHCLREKIEPSILKKGWNYVFKITSIYQLIMTIICKIFLGRRKKNSLNMYTSTYLYHDALCNYNWNQNKACMLTDKLQGNGEVYSDERTLVICVRRVVHVFDITQEITKV